MRRSEEVRITNAFIWCETFISRFAFPRYMTSTFNFYADEVPIFLVGTEVDDELFVQGQGQVGFYGVCRWILLLVT